MREEVLILGPEGSGKTVLLKHLQFYAQSTPAFRTWDTMRDVPPHLATFGTNIGKFRLKPPPSIAQAVLPDQRQPPKKAKKSLADLSREVTLREVGGAMGPIWDSYYASAKAVIYVIDSANPFQLSAAAILLKRLLAAPTLDNPPVLIVFTKSDIPSQVSLMQLKNMMCFDAITRPFVGRLCTVSVCSGLTGTGLEHVCRWLYRLHAPDDTYA